MHLYLESYLSFCKVCLYRIMAKATMSAKSLGTFPVICAIDELQKNPLRKTMLFEGHMIIMIGISDAFPNS